MDGPPGRPADAGAFDPAFEALGAAVEAGDDEVARRILAGIRARRPPERLARAADAYARILDGREALRALDLRLELEPEGDDELVLVLVAESALARPVELALPPGTLRRVTVGVAADGDEGTVARATATDAVVGLEIPARGTARVELGRLEVAPGAVLATRERFDLELRSGAVRVGDARLPAAEPRVEGAEIVVLAPFLPRAPVEPAELVRYVREAEEVHRPPLVERAVRIPEARREEALALLAPLVAELAWSDPERVTAAAPALRWLARTAQPGADPLAWAQWLAAWSAERERERAAERPDLELPPRLQ